ncbi:MarR family winged helix-turn-helix transcriptional regulator [Xanthovirga aplysinae]|uniref:MarR family winged helix-turn-helix transcriptional regulator n=1 Tax=Xanthovirga aplysinae TaxID=2529853 RepID=UPI0012BB5A9E|nr:MarR family transcriptional regulator [Xanthovirga aplysinae]MTI31662.1 MarR family transcriptional regulator [Xanthovirga aplysinae]
MDDSKLKLSKQVCFPIYSVSRLITKAYRPYLEELGITYPQYLVLLVLWEKDNLTVNEISKKLLLNTNTISPLLKRLEKLDLIQRKRSSEDERSVFVQLTDKGKQLKAQALPIPEKLIADLESEKIQIEDMEKLKNMLCEWLSVIQHKCESSTKN